MTKEEILKWKDDDGTPWYGKWDNNKNYGIYRPHPVDVKESVLLKEKIIKKIDRLIEEGCIVYREERNTCFVNSTSLCLYENHNKDAENIKPDIHIKKNLHALHKENYGWGMIYILEEDLCYKITPQDIKYIYNYLEKIYDTQQDIISISKGEKMINDEKTKEKNKIDNINNFLKI